MNPPCQAGTILRRRGTLHLHQPGEMEFTSVFLMEPLDQ